MSSNGGGGGDYPLVELEYETQYFGYSPRALVDTLASCACDEAAVRRAAVDTLGALGAGEPDASTLERLCAAAQAADRHWENFEKLQEYLCGESMVLRVPHAAVLPEDKVQLAAGRRCAPAALAALAKTDEAARYKAELEGRIAAARRRLAALERVKRAHDGAVAGGH